MALTKTTYSLINGAPANVKDFGAVGDGIADDTAAIQLAFNAGAGVYFPAGEYLVTSSLTIPSESIVRGESPINTIILADNTFSVFTNAETYANRIVILDLAFKAQGNNAISHTIGNTSSYTYNINTDTASSVTPPTNIYAAIEFGIALSCEYKNLVINGFTAGIHVKGGFQNVFKLNDITNAFYGVYLTDVVEPNFKNLSHSFETNKITQIIYGVYIDAAINCMWVENIYEGVLRTHYITNATFCALKHEHIEVANQGIFFAGIFTTPYNRVEGVFVSTSYSGLFAVNNATNATITVCDMPISVCTGKVWHLQNEINSNSAIANSAQFIKSSAQIYEYIIPLTSPVGVTQITFDVFTANIEDTAYGLACIIEIVNNAGTGGTHRFGTDAGAGTFQGGTGYISHNYTNSGSNYTLSVTVSDGPNYAFLMAKVTLVFESSSVMTLTNPEPLTAPIISPSV